MHTEPVLDRWYAAIRAADPEAFAAITTDDVEVFWNGDAALIPWAGLHRGRDAVLAFFSEIARHLVVVEVRVLHRSPTAAGVTILAEGRWTVRGSGAEVRARMANVFSLDGERVRAFEVYNDTAAFAVGLGSLNRSRPSLA